MRRALFGAALGVLCGCVGDAPAGGDGGGDGAPPTDGGADVAPMDAGADAITDSGDGGDAGPPRPVLAIGSGAGAGHTCAVLSSGAIRCWGHGASGQLGDGNKASSLVAVAVKNPPANKKFDHVSGGPYHSCAHATSGEVYCWGGNGSGMLGDGTTTEHLDPAPAVGVVAATMVATASTITCALDATKTKCWGTGSSGALARPINGDYSTPKDALEDALNPASPILGATSVTVGERRACVLQNGGAKCWGLNNVGQVGAMGCVGASCPPSLVTGLESGVLRVRSGYDHTCAVVTGDTVKCWGSNAYLELGGVGGPAPIDVSIPDPVADLALGMRHSCALTKAGDVYCWGRNSEGEVHSPITSNAAPTKVAGLTKVVQIAAGIYHTCALLESGEVDCWGSNQIAPGGPDVVGCLGNGSSSLVQSATPVKVLGLP